jgi:hypothetical protein
MIRHVTKAHKYIDIHIASIRVEMTFRDIFRIIASRNIAEARIENDKLRTAAGGRMSWTTYERYAVVS